MKRFIVFAACFSCLYAAVFAADTVHVYPGNSIADSANAHPEGTIFKIHAGVYRIVDRIPKKDNQQFIGELDASGNRMTTISGAIKLENWTKEGKYWVHRGVPVSPSSHGICHRGFKRACGYPQNLYYNSLFLREAETLDHLDTLVFDRMVYPHIGPYEQQADNQWLDPGTWYLDMDSGVAYTLEDPAGENVDSIELSIGSSAFTGSSKGVVIKNLVIEKFANVCQGAALHMSSGLKERAQMLDSTLWKDIYGTIDNCEVRFNHGIGVSIHGAGNFKLINSHIHHNGELGIKLQSTCGTLVQGNEIAYNDLYRTIGAWFGEEGGLKVVVRDLFPLIRCNYVHHNWGKGLWCDGWVGEATIEGNLVEHNGEIGIFLEIMDTTSTNNIARYNIARRNGQCSWFYGGQIITSAARSCYVHHNVVLVDEKHDANSMTVMWQIDDNYRLHCAPWRTRFHHNDITLYNPSQDTTWGTAICEDRPEAEHLGGLDLKYGFGISTKGLNDEEMDVRMLGFNYQKTFSTCKSDTCVVFDTNSFHLSEGYTRKSWWWPHEWPDFDGDSISDDLGGKRYSFEEFQTIIGQEKGSTLDYLPDTTGAYAIQTMRKMGAPRDIVESLAKWLNMDPDIGVRPDAPGSARGFIRKCSVRYANGLLRIQSRNSAPKSIRMFDSRGRQVVHVTLDENRLRRTHLLSIGSLAPGIYSVRVGFHDASAVFAEKALVY